MKPRTLLCLSFPLFLAACQSHLQPLRPMERAEVWVPDAAASQPTTAAATGSTTQPGHVVVKMTDPNQTSRFIYKADYDGIWRHAIALFHDAGFVLDRQDYRLGVLTTRPLRSAQIVEFWRPLHVDAQDSLENTLHSQRRSVRMVISRLPDRPDFYEIAMQVRIERETNPSEQLGGPTFVAGSAFGRSRVTLRSDFAPPVPESERWLLIGHDPDMEARLLGELLAHL